MIRQPPISTLFPYPTLSRSPMAAPAAGAQAPAAPLREVAVTFDDLPLVAGRPAGIEERERITAELIAARSEEHTSELQSRQYLVCRLLLEKKKKNTTMHHHN